jgi:hypothetical protein
MRFYRRQDPPVNSKPVWPHRVDISFDRLRIILEDFDRSTQASDRWQAPAGLLLGLLTSVIVTDFSAKTKRLGLDLATWERMFFAATGAAALWLLIEIRSAKSARTIDSLFEDIARESKSKVHHRVLFIAKRNVANRQPEVLMYFDHAWNCYLLPYESLEDGTFCGDAPRHSEVAARFLGLSGKDVRATHVESCDFSSVKYHPLRRQETTYAFRFLVLRLGHLPNFSPDEIQIGSTQLRWMTIDDLLAHADTRQNNSDVILRIRECMHQLLIRPQDSIS